MQSNNIPAERGVTIWLTGLSGAGKSTITDELVRQLTPRAARWRCWMAMWSAPT